MAKRQAPPADPKEAESRVRITDFGGIACGLDLHDTDPGESYYQVNAVPFHPGELRVRRGFVVCQFESGPSDAFVATPTVRYADAKSSMWMHSDARRNRDIDVAVWERLTVTAEQPKSNFHHVQAFSRIVMNGLSHTRTGNIYSLSSISGAYSLGGSVLVSSLSHHGWHLLSAATAVYPGGSSLVSGVSNTLLASSGQYKIDQ